MENGIRLYLEELKRRGYKERNVEDSRRLAVRVAEYLRQSGRLTELKEFRYTVETAELAGGFVKWVENQPGATVLANATRTHYLDAAKQYIKFTAARIAGRPIVLKRPDLLPPGCPEEFVRYYEEYTRQKRLENIPAATLKKGLESVRKFYRYLLERKVESFVGLTKEDVKDFSLYLTENTSLSIESVSRYMCGVKTFLLWLSGKGICRGMAGYLRKIKRNERLSRNILTRKEIAKLFEVRAENLTEFMMKSVFVLLYGSGVRISELLGMKTGDVDLEKGEARIYESKTGKERTVILGEIGTKYLRLYLELVREKITYGETGEYLFVSRREGKQTWSATVNVHLKNFCRRAGIKKKITCHCFRHSYGTHLLENGAGIKQVSELLGHDSLKSTEKYTHLNPEHLRKTIEKYHPMERG